MRFPIHSVLIGVLTSVSAAATARAVQGQTSATLDARGMHLEYEGPESAGALLLSPAIRLDWPRLSLDAGGTLSRFDAGEWSAQTAAAAAYFMGPFGALQGEVDASVDASAQPGAPETGAAGAGARLHLLAERYGAWLGVQGGRASNGFTWRSTFAGELGGWIRHRGATAIAQLVPSVVGDSLRYLDAQATARVEHGRLELSTTLGLRDWIRPNDLPATAWGTLNGAFWLGDHVALAVGGGSYPADLAQGFTAGSYVTVGIRLAIRRPTSRQAISATTRRTLPPAARPVVNDFQARRGSTGGGEWTLEVAAPTADRVELMGDFTDWQGVALRRRADGRWSVVLPIAPGTHRMNLRVDAGAWGVPPGLPIVTDEFNGVVALLILQ